jgi:hypothetical protein
MEASRTAVTGTTTALLESATVEADPFNTDRATQGPAAAEPAAPPQNEAVSDAPPAETTFEQPPASVVPPSEEAPAGSDEVPFGDLN